MDNELLSSSIAEFLGNDTLPPVILCIGTDKVTGDALGPMVGDFLTERFNVPCFVYGTFSYPVTALNLSAALGFIKSRHESQKLIAVDSSMGSTEQIGSVKLTYGGIRPGAASGKALPVTGDLSVTATVAALDKPNALESVRLGLVKRLAENIAFALNKGITSALSNRR